MTSVARGAVTKAEIFNVLWLNQSSGLSLWLCASYCWGYSSQVLLRSLWLVNMMLRYSLWVIIPIGWPALISHSTHSMPLWTNRTLYRTITTSSSIKPVCPTEAGMTVTTPVVASDLRAAVRRMGLATSSLRSAPAEPGDKLLLCSRRSIPAADSIRRRVLRVSLGTTAIYVCRGRPTRGARWPAPKRQKYQPSLRSADWKATARNSKPFSRMAISYTCALATGLRGAATVCSWTLLAELCAARRVLATVVMTSCACDGGGSYLLGLSGC